MYVTTKVYNILHSQQTQDFVMYRVRKYHSLVRTVAAGDLGWVVKGRAQIFTTVSPIVFVRVPYNVT